MIRAVTFDFWDTLVVEESNEGGRISRQAHRQNLFVEEVLRHHPDQDRSRVSAAYAEANAWVARRWIKDQVTPTIAQRLAECYRRLRLPITPGFVSLNHTFEAMALEHPPQLSPNVAAAIGELSQQYALGIVADTLFSPGRTIRAVLDAHGLLPHFTPTALIFSDEFGSSKPNPRVFTTAATALGVPPHAIVHVGDRENTDVVGAQGAGVKSVLYTGVVDRGASTSAADRICADFSDLPALLTTW